MSTQKVNFNNIPLIDSEEYYSLPVEEQNAIEDAICYTEIATTIEPG